MTLKAVVAYLDYRLKANEEQTLFEVFVAENLATISAGNRYKERMGYSEKRNAIWGEEKKKDTRTARQIIDNTFAARGVKVKWKNKEKNDRESV